MSDDSVRYALRSDARLVVVEAPAGCGKTHQGADYARAVSQSDKRVRLLILTHTHAACSMFAERTKGSGHGIEIRTIDSLIVQVAAAYHAGLGVPADTATWVRQKDGRYGVLAVKVATLLKRHPMIAAALAQRYPVVVCDEHQDSSGDQHAVVMSLLGQGSRLRIFADPMQRIFKEKTVVGGSPPWEWPVLLHQADVCDELDFPHRWSTGCADLGRWTLAARETLKGGGRIDLRGGLPPSIAIVFAENEAPNPGGYQLSKHGRRPIDTFEQGEPSLLILTRHNRTARSFRGLFNRRVPLWEGYTRPALDKLVDDVTACGGDAGALAAAVVKFLGEVGKGFTPSAFGRAFELEAADGCTATRRGKPAKLQKLARFLVTEPNHRGVARMLQALSELKASDTDFSGVEIDHHREFREAIRLGGFDTPEAGLTEITHRRTYARPKPPEKAISTIHKAKGLECGSVVVMPCDATVFPDKTNGRCLLYVALSRAKSRLLLVVPRSNPSPLLIM